MDISFASEALPSRQFLPFPLLFAKGFHENIVCLLNFFFFFFFSGKVTSQPSPYIQYRACTTGSQKVW